MRDRYKEIEKLLKEADIEGYIEIGAPVDEYEDEARAIGLALDELHQQELNFENISRVVSRVWETSFNLDEAELRLRQDNIYDVSRSILKSYNI